MAGLNPQPFATGTVSFSAHEPEHLTEGARDLAWNSEYLALGRGFQTDVAGAQASRTQLLRANFRAASIARGEAPPDAYVFAMTRSRRGRAHLGGEELSHCNVGVIRPGRGYDFHTAGSADLLLLSILREQAESKALAAWGKGIDEAGDRATFPLKDAGAGRALVSTWSTRLDELLRSPVGLADRATAREIEEQLLGGLLRNIALREGTIPFRRQAARRAAGYLGEEWRRPLRLADICDSAGAPERTLRQGFEELYGRSPMSYLRLVRLRAARAMLQRAGLEKRISEIALWCGFKHLGSFSVDYRRTFGETPSQTRSRSLAS